MCCDTELHDELWGNVVLSGGNTMFPGLKERLQKELQPLAVLSRTLTAGARKLAAEQAEGRLARRRELLDLAPDATDAECLAAEAARRRELLGLAPGATDQQCRTAEAAEVMQTRLAQAQASAKSRKAEARAQAERETAAKGGMAAEDVTSVGALFEMFDTDSDGTLNKEEYKAYIKGRGDWGTGVFTEERYDVVAWRLQCQKAECTAEEGITRSAFERLVYGKYRRGRAQDDRHVRSARSGLRCRTLSGAATRTRRVCGPS
jgi:hypothetical protein